MHSASRRPVKKTTRDQFEMLIRELKRHPEILRRTAYFGTNKQKADQVWEIIAQKLNSIGPPLRTVIEWKKIWADLKSRRKKSIYNANPSNINNISMPTEDDDLLVRENIIDPEDSSDRIVLDLLSAPTLSPQSVIDYEIEEIEVQPTSSIKIELHEDIIETTEQSNALDTHLVKGTVFGLGEAYQLEHSTMGIKTESPPSNLIIESCDEAETLNIREPSPTPCQPQQQQPQTRRSSPKALRYSLKTIPTQLKQRPPQTVENESSTLLLHQQLQNQTHLLEALTNSIISLTDRQAAAAERQALATERQAAATERQAATMEAVLEHFRARQYADLSRNNIHRNK